MPLERRPLGEAAEEYAAFRLGWGLSLSKAILQAGELGRFSWSVYMPDDAEPVKLPDLKHGRVAGQMESFELLVGELTTFLESSPGRTLIVESLLASRGDPFLAEVTSTTRYFGDEVYYLAGADRDAISEAIGDGESAGGVAFFVTSEPPDLATRRDPIAQDDLKAVVAATELIGLDAFDGESFLLGVLPAPGRR